MQTNTTTTEKANTTESAAPFPLGQTVITRGALDALTEAGQSALEFLRRHQSGDWGEVCNEDKRENEFSIAHGFRILSAYRTKVGVKLWVLTERDRSANTILLPSEY